MTFFEQELWNIAGNAVSDYLEVFQEQTQTADRQWEQTM